MRVRQRVRTPTTTCCTQRKIGPVIVVDKGGRCAIEAADKTKIERIVVMPTLVPDLPEAGVVETAPETGKQYPPQKVGPVARKATGRESAGKSVPIRINLDGAKTNMGISRGCTTPRAPKEPEIDRAQPSQ